MPLPKDTLFFGYRDKLTEEQTEYVNAIFDYRLVMVDAKAGSGKTTLAVACAKMLGKDLLYIFSPVEENKMGYRKGSQQEKEEAYIVPLIDALLEINENPQQVIYKEVEVQSSASNVKKKLNEKPNIDKVWVYPKSHVFARGTNIKNKTVIIDEAQNFTRGELKKVLSRISDDCHVICIGHTEQCDLPDPSKSGFRAYIEHFRNQAYCKVCVLSKNFRGELADWADKLTW